MFRYGYFFCAISVLLPQKEAMGRGPAGFLANEEVTTAGRQVYYHLHDKLADIPDSADASAGLTKGERVIPDMYTTIDELFQAEAEKFEYNKAESKDANLKKLYGEEAGGKALGQGSFGNVTLVEKDGKEYARKQLRVTTEAGQPGDGVTLHYMLWNEIAALLRLGQLHAVWSEKRDPHEPADYDYKVTMILTKLEGIDCFDAINAPEDSSEASLKRYRFSKDYIEGGKKKDPKTHLQDVHITAKLMLAELDMLHGKGIIHRDIKLENMRCNVNEQSGALEVKIFDFGFSTVVDLTKVVNVNKFTSKGTWGSRPYLAPEILMSHLAESPSEHKPVAADMFAVGVSLYAQLHRKYFYVNCGMMNSESGNMSRQEFTRFPAKYRRFVENSGNKNPFFNPYVWKYSEDFSYEELEFPPAILEMFQPEKKRTDIGKAKAHVESWLDVLNDSSIEAPAAANELKKLDAARLAEQAEQEEAANLAEQEKADRFYQLLLKEKDAADADLISKRRFLSCKRGGCFEWQKFAWCW
jgi:serine/threonine protein kinase